ncbi:MAG: M48 family metalloprotease [Planctomycetota bacterium]
MGFLFFCGFTFVCADPSTLESYFTADEILRSQHYFQRFDFWNILSRIITYGSILILLLSSLHLWIDRKIDRFYEFIFRRSFRVGKLNFGLLPQIFFKVICWILLLECYWTLTGLPISYLMHQIKEDFGLTNQTFWVAYGNSWVKYWYTLANKIGIAILFLTFYQISRRYWWIAFGLLFFFSGIVVNYFSQAGQREIDGVETRKSLEPGPLRTKLEAEIQKSGVQITNIKYTDESKRTTVPQAWILSPSDQHFLFFTDSCFKYPDEMLVNMALHEIGHLFYKHTEIRRIYRRVSNFVNLFLVALLIQAYLRIRYRKTPEVIEGKGQVLIYLIFSLLATKMISLLILVPVDCWLNQTQELQAERYALEHTHDPETMIFLRKTMALASLTRLEISWWSRYWYDYPPVIEFLKISEEFQFQKKPSSSSESPRPK